MDKADHQPPARQTVRLPKTTLATRAGQAFLVQNHSCDIQHRSQCRFNRLRCSHLRLRQAPQCTTGARVEDQEGQRALQWSWARTITFLVLDLEEGGSHKHERPVDDIDEGNEELVFEVVLEVVNVHTRG